MPPVAAVLTDNPEGTSNNSTTTPAEGQTQTQEQLLAGKFKTPQELEQGYVHQFAETQRIIARNQELEQRTQALLAMGIGERTQSTEAGGTKSNVETLAETMGVDVSVVRGALAEVATETFEPLNRSIAARQMIAQRLPDYGQFEPEIAQFLQTHPDAAATFTDEVKAGRPADAMELAYYRTKAAISTSHAPNNATTQGGSQSGETQATARLDSGIPAGGSRVNANEAVDREAHLAKLLDEGRRTGNMNAYISAVLERQIPRWHLENTPEGPRGIS